MTKTKYLLRHSFVMRVWHWSNIICTTALILSGLVVFVPYLSGLVGQDVTFIVRMIHRIFGLIFISAFVVWIVLKPHEFTHSMKSLVTKWDEDDKEFMKRFFVYLFKPGMHMPKQHFVKSGQRFADLSMYILILLICITGIILYIGTPVIPYWLFKLALFGHDMCFFGMLIQLVAHVYLGAAIFPPYERISKVMIGRGYVNESDALYHWGHWAEEELEKFHKGEKSCVIEVESEDDLPVING